MEVIRSISEHAERGPKIQSSEDIFFFQSSEKMTNIISIHHSSMSMMNLYDIYFSLICIETFHKDFEHTYFFLNLGMD